MSGNAAAVMTKPAFRKIEWLKRDIAVERRPDGVIVLQSRIPLKAYEKHIPASLAKWASQTPDRIWLAQRAGPERQWRKLSYGEAKRTVDALTQGLLNLKLEPGRPVAILSGNSIEHALMTMAAMQAQSYLQTYYAQRAEQRGNHARRISGNQEVRQAEDAGHRRADLMAHVGQELAFGAVRPLGGLHREGHLLGPAPHRDVAVDAQDGGLSFVVDRRGVDLRGAVEDSVQSAPGGNVRAEEIAARLETINYEVTCAISPRVPRVTEAG